MERRKICRYFQRGSCRKDNCPFVHLKQNRKACTYYMEGNCRKGVNCNFYHPPKEEEKLVKLKEELKNKTKIQKNKEQKEISSESEHQQRQEQERTQLNHQQLHEKKEQVEKYVEQIKLENQHEKQQNNEKDHSQSSKEDKIQTNQKISKINFLLGLNQSENSDSDQQEQIIQPISKLQFVKTYLKKFVDHNKTAQMKQQIKKNQAKYFKGAKFLDLVAQATDLKQKQYLQIIRKYTDHFSTSEAEPYHFSVKIRPLLYEKQIDLHFQFLEDTLDLDIDAAKYPQERSVITILNKSVPDQYKQKFLYFIQRYHQNKSLLQTLKFIQNNFQKLYKQSHFKLQNQFYSRKELQKKLKNQFNNKVEGGKQQKQVSKKKKKVKAERYKNPFVAEIPFKQQQKMDNLVYGYELSSETVLLQNCEYILIQKVLLYLQCVCQQKIMYILDGTSNRSLLIAIKLQCRKCQNIISVALERNVIQPRRQALGRVAVNSAHLADMGGLGFKIGCICANQISKGKIYLPGQRVNANCHNCFRSIQVNYMGLKFFNPLLKIPQVKSESELPGKGTCKHIKLSFRWHRYGCCGRCFSCDDCHIINSVIVHEKLKGITMLCGYCSRQQPINNDCVHCHKQLVKGIDKTGHWQGGYGCRDQAVLSRKDNKKYTGLTKKKEKEK